MVGHCVLLRVSSSREPHLAWASATRLALNACFPARSNRPSGVHKDLVSVSRPPPGINRWPAVLAASRLSAAPACAMVFTLARLGHTAKTRHQKRPAETGGRNGASIAKFRTRRLAHICETSRYGPVFERPSYLTRLRRTGWLGRRDSNLCILESEFAKTLSPGGRDSNLRISIYRRARSTPKTR